MALLSVIIATHDRPEDLRLCLEALTALSTGEGLLGGQAEIIVVDSASTEPCASLVEGFSTGIPHLRCLRIDEPGLSKARNAGVAAATGEIVAFLDDDAQAQAGWAESLMAAFAEREAVGCVGGACLPGFQAPRPRWLSDGLLPFVSVTTFTGPGEPRSSATWPFGANMAFRAEALRDAGGFSEDLGRTGASLLSGEDSEMVRRMLARGWRVWLEPEARVVHKVPAERMTSHFYWRRLWWGGVSRARKPSLSISVRLAAAVPIRAGLWVLTRDRLHLYRLAESAGYFCALVPGTPWHKAC
jgi:GT2 family glycosyltransferase